MLSNRRDFAHVVTGLKQTLYVSYAKRVSHAQMFEGCLKDADVPFRCLCVDNTDFADYISRKVFEPRPATVWHGRVLNRSLAGFLKSRSDYDLCIALLPRGFGTRFGEWRHFQAEDWVNQRIDTSAPVEEIRKRFHTTAKHACRKIIKYGFTFRVSRDVKEFDYFYYRMFVPLIGKQHGARARLDSYEEMLPFFRRGYLLLIFMDGQCVSGALCHEDEGSMVFRRIGVLEGSEDLLKKGAQSAVYDALIVCAKQRGVREIDLMYSRPFLNDGVFFHKNQWGARVHPAKTSESCVYFILPRQTDAAVRFLECNPIIANLEEGPGVLAGWTGPESPAAGDVAALKKKYYSPGLGSLLLLESGRHDVLRIPFESPD